MFAINSNYQVLSLGNPLISETILSYIGYSGQISIGPDKYIYKVTDTQIYVWNKKTKVWDKVGPAWGTQSICWDKNNTLWNCGSLGNVTYLNTEANVWSYPSIAPPSSQLICWDDFANLWCITKDSFEVKYLSNGTWYTPDLLKDKKFLFIGWDPDNIFWCIDTDHTVYKLVNLQLQEQEELSTLKLISLSWIENLENFPFLN